MTDSSVAFSAHADHELRLNNGDRVLVANQGAHVLSWQTHDGGEQLYLSPHSVWDGHTAIRGGVPICFPQFNLRGTLPKHGFARNLTWQRLPGAAHGEHRAELCMQLQHDPQTLALWPHAFTLLWRVVLEPRRLTLELTVTNTGATPLTFTGALHTYLRMRDIQHVRLHGLGPESVSFDAEFDQVFRAAAQPLRVQEGRRTVHCQQSESWPEHVVWNPGAEKCATLPDMPADGYRQMLCIEAAAVNQAIDVLPGAQWVGWQKLEVNETP